MRRMLASSRRNSVETSGEHEYTDRETIAYDVFEACGLFIHGEHEGEHGAAWTIAEAAGWDHLAGAFDEPVDAQAYNDMRPDAP